MAWTWIPRNRLSDSLCILNIFLLIYLLIVNVFVLNSIHYISVQNPMKMISPRDPNWKKEDNRLLVINVNSCEGTITDWERLTVDSRGLLVLRRIRAKSTPLNHWEFTDKYSRYKDYGHWVIVWIKSDILLEKKNRYDFTWFSFYIFVNFL